MRTNRPSSSSWIGRRHPYRVLELGELRDLWRLTGLRVAEAREDLGLTRRDLARAEGRPEAWLKDVEQGNLAAPLGLLVALAKARGVAAGWFFRRAGALSKRNGRRPAPRTR